MNTIIEPAMMPFLDSGSVMVKKALIGPAPRSLAASSRRPSIFTRCENSGRIMNGR
ncbi:hypothetical protein D3C85_1652970 [compost metagenome]